MSNDEKIIEARLDAALTRYVYEACNGDRVISERTFDETVEAAVECIKKDIEQRCTTDETKFIAKQEAECAFRHIASRFKEIYLLSGVLNKY